MLFFYSESTLNIKWPEYWSFSLSISPSNEYSGLISFRIGWFDLLAVKESQESSPAPQFKNTNSWAFSLLYGQTLISVHDYWQNHRSNYVDLCHQENMFKFFDCQTMKIRVTVNYNFSLTTLATV